MTRGGPGVRGFFVRLHRYVGLALAGWLVLLGLTGSALVYERELDAWLNPGLWHTTPGPALSPQTIADRVTAADARVTARWIPIGTAGALDVWVDWKPDPVTGAAAVRDYDQMFVDPATGAINGRRRYGGWTLTRATALPFVHTLHSSLFLPGRVGAILLGIVALAWLVHGLTGFWLTLPRSLRWGQWRRAWVLKRHVRAERRTYDLHRAGGLWAWGLMIAMAVSGVALTLSAEVFEPVVARVSPLSPHPWEGRTAAAAEVPSVSFDRALAAATRAAMAAGIATRTSGLFLGPEIGLYGVSFGQQEAAGVGQAWVYVDRATAAVVSVQTATGGSAGDVVERVQLPIHAGRVGGVATRVLAVLLGLAVAMLSATGVMVWWYKRRARRVAAGMHRRG
ncbi:PepSY-associated TM helix domain-containing protein [Sphingomonas montana]|uniref:PepSY-associated TM helix domain-containing protein n=1 Tax=Sphingomonas montana TaxID=1843236 RepID=UPI00096E13DF|nr:PepSY-associated TM helix domain-containing protein [Sphingomonas montana]